MFAEPRVSGLVARLLKDHVFKLLKKTGSGDPDVLLSEAADAGYGMGSYGGNNGVAGLMVCDSAMPVLSLARDKSDSNTLKAMLLSVVCKGWIVKDNILPGADSLMLCRYFAPLDMEELQGWFEEFAHASGSGRVGNGDVCYVTGAKHGVVAVASLRAMITHPDMEVQG